MQHYVTAPNRRPDAKSHSKHAGKRAGKLGSLGSEPAPHAPRRTQQSIVADVGGPDPVTISGYRSQSGRDWLHVTLGTREAWIERVAFGGQARAADETLAAAGVVLIGAGARGKLMHAAAQISEFEPRTLIERPGWNGAIYALPDGALYPKAARRSATAVFTTDHHRLWRSGSVGGWREEVAAPLADFDLASFILTVPFAALLRDLVQAQLNQGFELVGPKGCGKSTLQQLAASAVGKPVRPDSYWITLDTTVAGLEAIMNDHRDLPLILDDANHVLLNLPEAARASRMAEIAFKLESAQAKHRKTEPFGEPPSRFIYLISSNDSIVGMTQRSRSEGLKAACDRLLSLVIENDAPHGAFESLPAGFASSRELATSVLAAAARNHGHPFRRYARKLAELRSRDEPALRRKVEEHLKDFRKAVDVDENDGSAVRVADAFGLVVAAGRAGRAFGVLPDTFRPLEAAVACYRRNRRASAVETACERLDRYIESSDLPVVDRHSRLSISRAEWKRSPGALLIDRSGERLFVIAPSAFRGLFADHEALLADGAFKARMDNEPGRLGINKQIRCDGSDRVLCWRTAET